MTYGQKLENLLNSILRRDSEAFSISQRLMELASVVYALQEAVEGRDEESHDDNWLSIPVLIDSIKDWFPVYEDQI